MEATKDQLWALHWITHEDWSGRGLTEEEASELISKLRKTVDDELIAESIIKEKEEICI